jgi:type I restriction enzyme M protein
MDADLRFAIQKAIARLPGARSVVKSIDLDDTATGTIEYETEGVWIDPAAPGFTGGTAIASDEELVRAYLLARLVSTYDYPPEAKCLELERVYKPVGRPIGKGGRADVLVRHPPGANGSGKAFLFIECKAPSKYDADLKYLDGQLFRLSRQEEPRPRYLVYYTVELKEGELRERPLVIDTRSFASFQEWDAAGQPISNALPKRYGVAPEKRFANIETETDSQLPLDKAVTPEMFNRLREEIHDVVWGGGGTNNNEVFVYITKLILAKIFDEKETERDGDYRFQRRGDAINPEPAEALAARMNGLYREAEQGYLALPEPTEGPAFDASRISPEKLAFVVGRLEGISVTENVHPGDLLGEFFEQIVAQDFTQTKGQFFTPMHLVRFMLKLAGALEAAKETMLHSRDHLGRPTLPYVIDPSCGSGTFLIEYMRQVAKELGRDAVVKSAAARIREAHAVWFGSSENAWARDYLFGVENNYDLGLAAKVNMVLHGDGSMNTWIASGLAPFGAYLIDGRTNILGVENPSSDGSPAYRSGVNEQFDFVISNPPFSLKLSPDEREILVTTFSALSGRLSEALFVERWYQLLREGGTFCCVLPEALLDTSSAESIRYFILEHFRVKAVVSLPYDAFRPFTSTKTCIVLAEKRSSEEVEAWQRSWEEVLKQNPSLEPHECAGEVLKSLGWSQDEVFMAEPAVVGYKRRKNLSDLQVRNDLFDEGDEQGATVLGHWEDESLPADSRLGFRTTLANAVSRPGSRLDPKYRYFWDFQAGIARGTPESARPLGSLLALQSLPKVAKGQLDEVTTLIDLEYVESRQALLRGDVPAVDILGSTKLSFAGVEMVVSKLEPYLGKVLMDPPADALGSTEWIGLKRTEDYPLIVLAYALMLPEVCEAFRRLQSGKRHARLVPGELLDVRVDLPGSEEAVELAEAIEAKRREILDLRRSSLEVRAEIDEVFAQPHEQAERLARRVDVD